MAKRAKKEEKFDADEKQGILPDETSEQKQQSMKRGQRNEDVYSEEGLEELEEDDEIDTWEEGFMEGANEEGQLGKDALTGEPLMDIDDVVEARINGRMYRFVSEENARKFRRLHEKK